jgi:hypothetical protein
LEVACGLSSSCCVAAHHELQLKHLPLKNSLESKMSESDGIFLFVVGHGRVMAQLKIHLAIKIVFKKQKSSGIP